MKKCLQNRYNMPSGAWIIIASLVGLQIIVAHEVDLDKFMFSVGQKVVLVDDKWSDTVLQIYLQLPVLDTVYVVRAVRVGVS